MSAVFMYFRVERGLIVVFGTLSRDQSRCRDHGFSYEIISDNQPSTYTELLRLHLVSKTWKQSTAPFAFQFFKIRGSNGTQIIFKNWSSSIYAPYLPFPVKRRENDETSPKEAQESPIFMDQATKLIELIGLNLNQSTLVLSIEYVDLEGLESKSPALSKLRYFSSRRTQHNLDGIIHICQSAEESLKLIEFDHHSDFEEAKRILEPIRSILEGLVTPLFSENNPERAIQIEFPRLLFYIDYGPAYFWEHLKWTGETPFNLAPNLRHIVFILRWDGSGPTSVAATLVDQALESHGIQCHVVSKLEPHQDDLDYELNGPMD
ncbi:hypothetical protein DFH28DRAFT_1094532 [Melampsora americana]|nr:hypothetical protein DFH28DRAFT_1094532 [Melampsora americana]